MDENEKSDILQKEKSASRVTINGAMMGSLFFILTLVWTLGVQKFNGFIIGQLVMAIPLLFVSSLAYAKVSYRAKNKPFDQMGWITTTLGNNMILNVSGLMTATFSKPIAIAYFAVSFSVITIYYIINCYSRPEKTTEDIIKLFIVYFIMMIGGIIPLFTMF